MIQSSSEHEICTIEIEDEDSVVRPGKSLQDDNP